MANNRNVYQQQTNVSIPRVALSDIAGDDTLGKNDLKVLLILFTELNGWTPPISRNGAEDPMNFSKVSVKKIAKAIGSSKEKVEKSLRLLEELGYIEQGGNMTVKDSGYRFKF